MGNSGHVIFCQEFPHNEQGVCRRATVQQPVSVLPYLRPFAPLIFPESFQNLTLESSIDSLTRWNKLHMHNYSNVRKIDQHIDLMLLRTWHTLFGRGEGGVFHCEDCCFVSRSYLYSHDSSPVMTLDRKLGSCLTAFCSLVRT